MLAFLGKLLCLFYVNNPLGGGQHSVRFPHHQIVSTDVCSAGISSQSVPPGFIFPSMGKSDF